MPAKKKPTTRPLEPLAVDHYTVFPGGYTSFPIESKFYEAAMDHLKGKSLNVGGAYDGKEVFSLIHVKGTIEAVREAFRDFDYRKL
jgi:hypothetical protein